MKIRNVNQALICVYMIIMMCLSTHTLADTIAGTDTGLPVPRFVSIKSSEVNVRTGPSVRYPIKWMYIKKGLPVKVLAEFENWRNIMDHEGREGWIHESLLSGRRRVVVVADGEVLAYRLPRSDSVPQFRIESGAYALFDGCESHWCRIEVKDFKGWLQCEYLWGILDGECQ